MPSCAMFDYNRVASTDVMGLQIQTETVNGAVAAITNVSTPASPSKGRPALGRSQPFFIGVAGGTASGKTTVCDYIMQRLHDQCVVMLSQDSFYRGLTPDEHDNVTCKSLGHCYLRQPICAFIPSSCTVCLLQLAHVMQTLCGTDTFCLNL